MSHKLLEQYKLYVEMADRVSQRRQTANRFYISLLSGLGGLYLLLKEILNTQPNIIIWAILIIIISLLWWLTINSYRQLNSGKFKVIHEMEQQLPFACYDREWDYLGRGKNGKLYRQLSKVEGYVPLVIIVLSAMLITTSLLL
ncbi:MAG TPA: hypothetical protein DCG19_02880 [Cryomorphaceae bacterium]|nr:hypothetical protein [Owenweeksia sp.]HAD96320.1 hypothetical protein [Cryomorphaceae bacterium]HBF21840.1 hypothetical protein [Cryomorphaceae bacterium]|tara:strand:+ start:2135 stop:2563 length:429 start_codon:yes stop_codon:yes gene_type:complete